MVVTNMPTIQIAFSHSLGKASLQWVLASIFLISGITNAFAFEKPGSGKIPPVKEENRNMVVDPNITVRFNNPTFDCNTDKYCADVEFQSDLPGYQLFGMNVRFWYDDSVLELANFTGFLGGYSAVTPNPPDKFTSTSAGPAWFNFVGAAENISGGVQLTNEGAADIIIPTTGWAKVFQVCFVVDASNPNVNSFCPSLVWDKESNPANGGFIPNSDGVVITLRPPGGGTSVPATEYASQFNWQYSGSGNAPYGIPNSNNCGSINCAPVMTCPANISIACGASTLPANTGSATATDLCNGDPTLSYSDVISGPACPQPNLITRTWVAIDNCGNSNSCQQAISVGGNFCPSVVTSAADIGTNSLRDIIACSDPNDTITFSPSLAGQTIVLTSGMITFTKNLYIRSSVSPRIIISAPNQSGMFEIQAGKTVEFKDLDMISGISVSGNGGAAFKNSGILKLINVKVFKNAALPTGQYLIRNYPTSNLNLTGISTVEIN